MTASLDDTITVWIATHRWGPLDPVFIGLGWVEKLGAVWIALALAVGLARRLGIWRTLALAVFTGLVTFLADAATFGVKDVVLPGEMKALLNRVIEAQKEAEANVILRREETAATRSMAQTAKVLGENPITAASATKAIVYRRANQLSTTAPANAVAA